MNARDWLQIGLYILILLLVAPPLGRWIYRVVTGERTFLSPVLLPVEKWIYRLSGIRADEEMDWKQYAVALLIFNGLGFLAVLLLELFQAHLPLNPQGFPNLSPDLAFNTAVSFMTNTNWQAYSGEAVMSYLTQMAGLGVQNFLSAATGIAALLALTRGIAKKSSHTLGNFWCDTVRSTLYILLPLCMVFALVLISQGVVQTFDSYHEVTTLEGAKQVIPLGPAASQIAVKQLGTNGGGFFGVNSAHPFENPTPFSNFLEILAILLIPAAFPFTFGKMVGDNRHGWCLFAAMMILFLGGLGLSLWAEYSPNPIFGHVPSMEGKEVRLGVTNSMLWATATTDASNGSVNAMHSSLSPIAGGIAVFNIMLGEVIFGGVGAGMYGILMFVILTVFIAGLMVGRTPEYLGKKIEATDITWAAIAALAPCAVILIGTAISVVLPTALGSRANAGPHGFTEILYAWSSAVGNNGSAFAGLSANTPFYNWGLGLAMLIGRFVVIIPSLAIAGNLVGKKISPPSPGTFPTNGATFVFLLISVILIVGGLTFLPSLSLGPVIEHLLMLQGRTF